MMINHKDFHGDCLYIEIIIRIFIMKIIIDIILLTHEDCYGDF
jgi:hypothetical protein